jgi:hypothetical protein
LDLIFEVNHFTLKNDSISFSKIRILIHKKMETNRLFKSVVRIFLTAFMLVYGQTVPGQTVPKTQSLPDTSKMTYNQISQGLKLYVFPAKNQSQQKQKEDEFECYKWAMEQSGIDPLDLPKVEAAPVQSGPTGGAVKGAAKGAAAGAAIGAVAGDAGTGAAVGATAGAMAGRKAGKQSQAQQNQEAQANAAGTEKEMKDNYMKAFSVCIEGKGYTIK